MAEKTRAEYSVRNTSAALVGQSVSILFGYVTRVVFTHTLSEGYVGVNGLFSDILSVLSLSELGISTAIIYALYRPIAEGDIKKQQSLMRMYQNCYHVVALVVLIAGLCVIPFLPVLIKDGDEVGHVTFIYLLYLSNSVLSYLYIYKRSLIEAHQLSYITEIYRSAFLVLQNVVQIILLVTTHNFILFLLVYIACTIGNNVMVSRKADKLYPFLKEKQVEPLPKKERQGIFRHIRAMMMHKIGNVVVNNTDNLILSSMVGFLSVGRYSNYYLLIGSISQLIWQVFKGINASVGNLGATQGKEQVSRVFYASFFVGQWMYGWAAIALFELLDPFVEISFGKQYVFEQSIVFVLCLNFYLAGMRQASVVFRDSLGLFWHDRYKPVIESAINLVASVILTYYYGTIGVFLGTMISTVTTSLWVEPYVLYRYHLKEPLHRYFSRYAAYTAVWTAAGVLVHLLCVQITGSVWIQFLGRMAVCACIPPIIGLIVYHKVPEYQLVKETALELVYKMKRPKQRGK
jgi:O-antigen/teichoic acid export membrane protein